MILTITIVITFIGATLASHNADNKGFLFWLGIVVSIFGGAALLSLTTMQMIPFLLAMLLV